ncbi:EscU/YscU/HrcU family type III secretion system export apparatus switch protein, partial [Achromobacter xylosoxidans]
QLADTIVRAAEENGLYVHESRELVGLLMQVDLDAHIPPQLYVAVAELLAWLYRLESRELPEAAPPAPTL